MAGDLATEAVRPELAALDLLSTADLVSLMAADSHRATDAVVAAVPAITAAVEVVCARLGAGGRLVYVGAGTAGRLAVLDAAELGPTFSVPPGLAEAVIAGGDDALRHPAEGAEDDKDAGARALTSLGVTAMDVVIGVSASGRTPYVLGAIEQARSVGAATVGLSCNAGSPLSSAADHPHRTGRRWRGHRRVEPAKRRHSAKNRPQHHLDLRNGPFGRHMAT